MQTFNEGLDLPNGRTEQWTIDPCDGIPRGFAFLWETYQAPGIAEPTACCVMVTVPASKLIEPITDRMPAILDDAAWSIWLGESEASPEEAKGVLHTVEGVSWKMEREKKPQRQSVSSTSRCYSDAQTACSKALPSHEGLCEVWLLTQYIGLMLLRLALVLNHPDNRVPPAK